MTSQVNSHGGFEIASSRIGCKYQFLRSSKCCKVDSKKDLIDLCQGRPFNYTCKFQTEEDLCKSIILRNNTIWTPEVKVEKNVGNSTTKHSVGPKPGQQVEVTTKLPEWAIAFFIIIALIAVLTLIIVLALIE